MKYELTKDLETGNQLIDEEHRQLFVAINNLMDACAQGKGCDHVAHTTKFLSDYVSKHFADEERLQMQSKYPDLHAHKQFHEKYKQELAQIVNDLNTSGPTLAVLNHLNIAIGTIVTHIHTMDKKLAMHLKKAIA